MAIVWDDAYKTKITTKLTRAIGQAIQDGELESERLSEVCQAILAVMDTLKTHEQLVDFLTKLSEQWPFFASVLNEEKSQGVTVDKVEQMFERQTAPAADKI